MFPVKKYFQFSLTMLGRKGKSLWTSPQPFPSTSHISLSLQPICHQILWVLPWERLPHLACSYCPSAANLHHMGCCNSLLTAPFVSISLFLWMHRDWSKGLLHIKPHTCSSLTYTVIGCPLVFSLSFSSHNPLLSCKSKSCVLPPTKWPGQSPHLLSLSWLIFLACWMGSGLIACMLFIWGPPCAKQVFSTEL